MHATSQLVTKLKAAPRLIMHAGAIVGVGAIVLTGSTGHSSRLNPLADSVGYGSVLTEAAAMEVAAQVAEQTNMIVTQEVDSTAKTMNAQASLPTSDEGTLAQSQVIDTSGVTTRGITNYTIQDGDTLSTIASQFSITTDTVRWANNIQQDTDLKAGQKLQILPVSGVTYTPQDGDTPQSIASKFQANPDQIIAFNNAEATGIQTGKGLIIPDGVITEAPRAAAAPAAPAASKSKITGAPAGGGSLANTYSKGYCTWYVASRRAIPSWWGNANTWYSNARISGYAVGTAPRPGAIAWTGAGYYGHVAYVESVSGNSVTVSEMNWNGRWNQRTTRVAPASSFRYIH